MNIAATRSGWIFSPTSDLCMFWGPILMACVAWFFFSNVESFKTVHLMLGILLFNSMHVVSTLGPVYRRAKDGEISKLSFYVAPVIISALAFLVFLYSKTLFFAVIAPITLYHIIRQQYGWVMVSRRKFGETSKDKWIDTLSVWNAALGPALWWLSPLSPIEKSYFKPQDFAFTVPEFIANIALYCYLFFILAYVAYTTFISTKRFLNWGKISLIASTYLWFASLLLFPDRYVFFFALIYIHGLPYIAHTLKDFAKPKASTGYTRSALTYFSAILILGLIYAGGSYLSNSAHPPPQALGWIEYLLWLPLIPHYYYDSLLWKHRSSFKKCL